MEFRSKNQLVESLIREAIAKGEILPGERLLQEVLARKLGISATPIREALRRLEAQGVVTHEANKGVRVAEIKPEDAAEVYLIRSALEALAVQVASMQMTPADLAKLEGIQAEIEARTADGELQELRSLNLKFHFLLYHACGMRRLEDMISHLWTQYPWDTLYVIPGRALVSLEEHRAVIEALRRKDGHAAAEAMSRHIEAGCSAVLAHLSGKRE